MRDLRCGQRVDAKDVVDFQPFAPIVAAVEIPKHLQTLTLDMYGGDTDPIDHLRYFNTKMVIGGAIDAVKCRLLPSTFKGVAMTWFIKQPPYSISNFTDLSTKFLTQFSSNQTQKAIPADLFNIRQHVGKRIKTFMARFSRVSVQLEDASPEVCVAAFKNGLRCGSLNKDLIRRPAKDMMDLRARAQEFILVEQDEQTKKDRDNWRTQPEVTAERGSGSKEQRRAQTPRQQRPAPYPSGRQGPQINTWHRKAQPALANQGGNAPAQGQKTKLNSPLSTILRAVGQPNVVQYPRPPRRPPVDVDTTK
ncbi:uncharacterized protein LOC130738039 [Lotus japonicus]|uniref:uncharacterized protein LOC130738039 n=1 Tax=Lotus japonicus TaxID=34305 RepID=UPI00258F8934|nr:uncharacterized protein LOC130738039 [Lotus japonicus]